MSSQGNLVYAFWQKVPKLVYVFWTCFCFQSIASQSKEVKSICKSDWDILCTMATSAQIIIYP